MYFRVEVVLRQTHQSRFPEEGVRLCRVFALCVRSQDAEESRRAASPPPWFAQLHRSENLVHCHCFGARARFVCEAEQPDISISSAAV